MPIVTEQGVTYEDYRRVSAHFTQQDVDRYIWPTSLGAISTQHERMNAILAHTFGERIAPAKAKGPKPVANFLAPPPGPTAQEQAAADEWLRNSPWG